MDLKNFQELLFVVILFFAGLINYALVTNNRGSFADTPEWSKVVRRIIELSFVLFYLLLLIFLGWENTTLYKILLILPPVISLAICILVWTRFHKKGVAATGQSPMSAEETDPSKKPRLDSRLPEHLINTIILSLFFLTVLLSALISFARFWEQISLLHYCTFLLDAVLSAEFCVLFYHILRLIYIDNLPGREITQILKIYKELDE